MRPLPFAVAVTIPLAIALSAIWYAKRSRSPATAPAPIAPVATSAVTPPVSPSPAPPFPVLPAPQSAASDATAELDALATELRELLQANDPTAIDRWLERLAHRDPLRALDLVSTLAPAPRDRARNIILAAWMHEAPRPALAWAHANYSDFFNLPAYAAACVELRDISLLEEGLLRREDSVPAYKGFPLQRITLGWATADPAFMMAWVQKLDPGVMPAELRNYAMAGVLEARARTEPDEVLKWIQQADPYDHNSRRKFYQALAQGWKETGKLDAAEKFFGTDPANMDYHLALQVVVKELAMKKPERVEDWLRIIPTSSVQVAMSTASIEVEKHNPTLAVRWRLIYNPELNNELSLRILDRTLAVLPLSEREDVARLIESTPQLAPENRARLLRTLTTAK